MAAFNSTRLYPLEFTSESLFQFAADLSLAQGAFLRDSSARTGSPEWGPERPDFDSHTPAEQLDALGRVCHEEFYRTAVAESVTEGELALGITQAIANSAVTDAQVGALVRRNALRYAQDCAEFRGDDMRDFL